jgi:uncharacterized protein with PIN domain
MTPRPGDNGQAPRDERQATFRFYQELNDFLPPERRKITFSYRFRGTPSVKDTIQAIGVPHTEIDLILVDGRSVGFDQLLSGGERVAVYPMFERLDITPVVRLRPKPLREPRFVADVHLGRLARYLRTLGFDTLYSNDYDDAALARISAADRRILLTRDKGLLKRSEVTRGYWLRHTDPRQQIAEVVAALQLSASARPFSRCIRCNGSLEPVSEAAVRQQLPVGLRGRYAEVSRCRGCAQLYWPGSHFDRLSVLINEIIQ